MIRYHARWVLPISRPPLERATVVEDNGRIVYVGPRADAPPGEDRDLGDAALLPGLVNAHTHLELTAFAGVLDEPTFRDWILTLQAAKAAVMTRESYVDSARLGIADGLRAGITTYADTCDSGVALQVMREAGVRGIMYQEVFGPDPAQCEASMRDLEKKLGALDPLATDLQRLGVSPHAPYTVSDELLRRAAALGRPIAIHLAESEAESQLVRDASGPFADGLRRRGIAVAPRANSPVTLLDRLGVLDARPLLIHCVRTDDADLRAIVAHDCSVAHCPISNRSLGHGVAPLAEMLATGIRTGLGSDSMASNDRMDILAEARSAAAFQRTRSKQISPALALSLATLGGARALGLSDRIGTLDVGKDADLAAFDLPSGTTDPVADLLSSGTPLRARAVTIGGAVKLWDHTLAHSDPKLPSRVREISASLTGWRFSSRTHPPHPGN